MSFRMHVRKAIDSLCKLNGYRLVNTNLLYDWQRNSDVMPSYNTASRLPQDAMESLHPNNPRLLALKARYAAVDNKVTTPSYWVDNFVGENEMQYFRGDNAYVWQLRGPNMNVMAYALTAYYIKSIDKLGLLEKLKEDEMFGIYTFIVDNKCVSRDLLDSITEIYFLERHLGLSKLTDFSVLDIGAGYGRLAHRMVMALSNISHYYCTDAYPVSTFISQYYLRFRELTEKAQVVPLDEVEQTLANNRINLAINIHSFSECSLPAIEWWVALLAKYCIKYVMIVPNSGSTLQTGTGDDFQFILEKYAYRLRAKDAKYQDAIVQEYGINPSYHYLFELSETRD